MSRVAVVAHACKSFGGGLAEPREVLALDGGIRRAARHLRIDVRPRSVTICVPA